MSRIPFTVYDILAYLSSGSLIIALADYIYGQKIILQDDVQSAKLLIFLFLAYICGHVVASLASLFLEEIIVGRLLGKPSTILMAKSFKRWPQLLFPGYYRPIPENTRKRVLKQAKSRSFTGQGESLFLHVFSIVRRNESDRQRLDEFRNLYGFCRNTSFTLLVVAIMLAVGTATRQTPPSYSWALVALFFSVAMLYRYLKFFRQYSYHLFVTYAELSAIFNSGEKV